jgi:hypothetical protein
MSVKTVLFACLASSLLMIIGSGQSSFQPGTPGLVAAKVLSSEGEVEIRRPAADQPQVQKIAFKTADELKAGDTIITGRKGRLVLGLSDGSQAVIAAQTTVVIKDLTQSPRTLFHVLRGKTRIQIEKLGGQPNPYRVNTPTAVIAVRGTIFDVLVDGDETQVFLHEGEVAVTNLSSPAEPVFLFAGQTTRISLDRLPTKPGTFKAGKNDGTFQFQIDRRVAGDQRPNNQPGGRPSGGRNNPDFGRGSNNGPSTGGGVRPDFGRQSSPGDGPGGQRQNYGDRTPGKKS